MTLLEVQVAAVDREVNLLQESDETRLAIEEIEAVHDELEAAYRDQTAALAQRRALEDGCDVLQFGAVAETESGLAQQVSDEFENVLKAWNENTARIRQSGTVGKMAIALETYAREIAKNNSVKWNAWTESESSTFSISDAELESIKNVPAYASAIASYKTGRAAFHDNVKSIPESAEEVSSLGQLSLKLRRLKSDFKFDLPKFVLDFFNTLDANGSVPLASISNELMAWLNDNDELRNLSVHRRGMRRPW
jgi:hypothetical protein